MRVKVSIRLSKKVLERIDRVAGNRSAFVERAVRAYLVRIERQERDRRDPEIIRHHAERLNREARDTLGYQQLLRG